MLVPAHLIDGCSFRAGIRIGFNPLFSTATSISSCPKIQTNSKTPMPRRVHLSLIMDSATIKGLATRWCFLDMTRSEMSPSRVRDELLSVAGTLATDGETQPKHSTENPGRFMTVPFGVVEDKLREAEFFLEQFGATGSLDSEAHYYFSAFVSACRSVTFALQASLNGINEFDPWYESVRDQLKTDPLAPYFLKVRNDVVHTGINPLNRVDVEHLREHLSRQLSGSNRSHVLVVSSPHGDGSGDLVDAILASTNYFKSLVGVVFECYRRFLTTIDARWYFTEAHFRAMGKTLRDALAELEFPPAWLKGVPRDGESEAWRALRAQQPPCQINDLFERHLGQRIPDPEDDEGERNLVGK